MQNRQGIRYKTRYISERQKRNWKVDLKGKSEDKKQIYIHERQQTRKTGNVEEVWGGNTEIVYKNKRTLVSSKKLDGRRKKEQEI